MFSFRRLLLDGVSFLLLSLMCITFCHVVYNYTRPVHTCIVLGHFDLGQCDKLESSEGSIDSKNKAKEKETVVQQASPQAHRRPHNAEMEGGRQHKSEQSTHRAPDEGDEGPKCRHVRGHHSKDGHHHDAACVQG